MIELLNTDCLAYMATLPDNAFDLAIVDVPYGIGENGDRNKSRGKLAKAKDYKSFAGGDKSAPTWVYFQELRRVSRNQIIWGANHFISNMLEPSRKLEIINSSSWIVWDKVNGETDFADCELAWTSFTTAVRMVKFMWHGFMQGGDYNGGMQGNKRLNETRIHPTQKPVALYRWLLHNYAKPGDRILDTHLGSASSAIAAHQMGFDFVGTELDPDYYAASVKRYNNAILQQSLF